MRIHKAENVLIYSHVVSSDFIDCIIMVISNSFVPEACLCDSFGFLVEDEIVSE